MAKQMAASKKEEGSVLYHLAAMISSAAAGRYNLFIH